MLRGAGARIQTGSDADEGSDKARRATGACQDARACAGSAPSSIRPADRLRRRASAWSRPCATAGPTARACARIGPVALAHTRLAIIDVAGGDQPLDSEDGAVTVDRQRRDLQPRRAARRARGSAATASPPTPTARSSCTATRSTAPTASASSTASSPSRSGTTAAQRLVAARDAFGVKPLYWWSDGRRLALASEIGALLAAGLVAARGRPRRPRPLPRLPLRPRAAHAVRGRQQAPRRPRRWSPRRTARRGSRAGASRPGEPLDGAVDDELAASSPSASPTRSSAR